MLVVTGFSFFFIVYSDVHIIHTFYTFNELVCPVNEQVIILLVTIILRSWWANFHLSFIMINFKLTNPLQWVLVVVVAEWTAIKKQLLYQLNDLRYFIFPKDFSLFLSSIICCKLCMNFFTVLLNTFVNFCVLRYLFV